MVTKKAGRTVKKTVKKRATLKRATAPKKRATLKRTAARTVKKTTAPKRAASTAKKVSAKKPAASTIKKDATPKKPTTSASVDTHSIDALSKKVTTMSADTKSLSKDFKIIAKIFGDNQKILVSMKGMIDGLVGALDTIQKQSKRINSLEADAQKIFDGFGEMKAHTRMIAQLDSQAAKLQETVRGMDARTHITGGIESISKKVSENNDSIKNNAQMIIKIGRHLDKMRDDLGSSTVRQSSIEEIHSEIARLKGLFEETQAKGASDPAIASEISALSQKVDDLLQIPAKIGGVQQDLQKLSDAHGALSPLVGKLQDQIDHVASKADPSGQLDSIRDEFVSLRDEVMGRASKVDAGIASVTESLGRSEKSTAEFHQKADALFEAVQSIKGSEERTSGESTSEVMALLRLSELQSNIRMTAESKYGEISDLESIAAQTVDVLNAFDRLAVETGSDVRLPQGVRQWAVSKILECSDRWELRFSDVLGVLQAKMGVSLLKESLRISQVRDIFGVRAVDEIKSLFAEN